MVNSQSSVNCFVIIVIFTMAFCTYCLGFKSYSQIKHTFKIIKHNNKSNVRLSSSNLTVNTITNSDFNPKYSTKEQQKVLETLNGSSKDELLNLKISQVKVKNLENYKSKHGPFKSLNDILEVDGLGVKILEKLCEQIILDIPGTTPMRKSNKQDKRVKQLLVPPLQTSVSSVVGIHLASTGTSWAKLVDSQTQLNSWGYQDFVTLPNKMLPTDTFKLALEILKEIPTGDVYVFEGSPNMGLQGQKQASAVTAYTQQLELTSMLLALINTSILHNTMDDLEITNKVYFLRSKLPARLFKTLVGNEVVSSTRVVSQLIAIPNTEPFDLPCTPVNVDDKFRADYLNQSPVHKELLGQALMLAVAFSDLCVKKNLNSLSAVAPGRR